MATNRRRQRLMRAQKLAQQVAAVAKQFRKGCGLRTLALYGGGREGKDAQLEAAIGGGGEV